MMNFRKIQESLIINILGPAEKDRFRVIGFQRQAKSAAEVLDCDRQVQVYYSAGEFKKTGGRLTGPVQHDITFKVELTVSKGVEIDLSVINSGSATAAEKSNAIAEFQEGSDAADKSFDELVEIIYQILMDARNYDLGMPVGTISNRWIDRIQKDIPSPNGEYVVLTGSMDLTVRAVEEVNGEEGLGTATVYDITVDQDGDDVEKAGVSGTLGGS